MACNYNFRLDLPIAQKTEKQIAKFLLNKFVGLVYVGDCDNADYDLKFDLKGNVFTVEVKEDFTCYKTENIGVEYSCRGKDSGIRNTKATYYLYKIHEPNGVISLYWIKTKALKKMIADGQYHRTVNGGDEGSNTKCYLFFLSTVKELFNHLGDVNA
jgi:hypothetical protein